MTISEFKAWFEGYTENISGVPSKKQWERIKERVDSISGWEPSKLSPYPIIVEKPYPVRPWWPTWVSTSTSPTFSFNTTKQPTPAFYCDAAKEIGRLEAKAST